MNPSPDNSSARNSSAAVLPARLGRFTILGLSSGFGLGYAPIAPGTFGTLAALPLWWWMASLPWPMFALVTLAGILVAIRIAGAAEKIYGHHDVGAIVIDEIVGLLTTAIGVPFAWPEVVVAFILFRILDMLKPFPVRWIDRQVPGGAGVVLDDVAAGLMACALMHVGRLALGGWW